MGRYFNSAATNDHPAAAVNNRATAAINDRPAASTNYFQAAAKHDRASGATHGRLADAICDRTPLHHRFERHRCDPKTRAYSWLPRLRTTPSFDSDQVIASDHSDMIASSTNYISEQSMCTKFLADLRKYSDAVLLAVMTKTSVESIQFCVDNCVSPMEDVDAHLNKEMHDLQVFWIFVGASRSDTLD
ncbi:hypothetical protein GJ496_009673 [Pomphorhynchus laevis]|nr:hypothetical protein GJ496_009673 [Pomphorhynchus laevis]